MWMRSLRRCEEERKDERKSIYCLCSLVVILEAEEKGGLKKG